VTTSWDKREYLLLFLVYFSWWIFCFSLPVCFPLDWHSKENLGVDNLFFITICFGVVSRRHDTESKQPIAFCKSDIWSCSHQPRRYTVWLLQQDFESWVLLTLGRVEEPKNSTQYSKWIKKVIFFSFHVMFYRNTRQGKRGFARAYEIITRKIPNSKSEFHQLQKRNFSIGTGRNLSLTMPRSSLVLWSLRNRALVS